MSGTTQDITPATKELSMWTVALSEPALWFLVAIIIMTVLVVLFMLYFKKKLCFKQCGGCDSLLEPGYERVDKTLAKSYDQDGDTSSSDSDEENIRHLSKSIRRASLRKSRGSLNSTGSLDTKTRSLTDIPRDDGLRRSLDRLEVDDGLHSKTHGELSSDSELFDNYAFQRSTTSLTDDVGTHTAVSLNVPKSSSSPAGRSLQSKDWNIEESSVYKNDAFDIETEEQEIELAKKASAEIRDYADDDEADEDFAVEPISVCGTLDVALQYTMSDRKLQVTVVEARDLPSKDRGGATVLQVRIVILPLKKKRFKTKVQHIKDPRFGETFKLNRVSPEDLRGLGLRLRLYGIGKVRDRLIGEAVLRLEELNLIRDPQLTVTLQLEPRTDINRGDSDTQSQAGSSVNSSMQSLTHGGSPPELLTGLSYNPPTGRLCVEVIKGSHFRNMASPRAPDTYVKLTLLNSACQEMAQSKTGIRRSQPNPVFKEQFYFQVALFQLSEVTLMMSVYNRKSMKRKEMIGWVSLGRNSSSENEEQHWEEMKEGKGQQVCRWATLVES